MTFQNAGHGYSRRNVLKLAGLAAGAAIAPTACSQIASSQGKVEAPQTAEFTPAPTELAGSPVEPSPTSNVSRVVLVRTDDRVAGTRNALDLLQPDGISGQTVFIKPNYNTADPPPASTDTALLEALIQELQAAGAGQMTIGDRSGMADSRQTMMTKGAFDLADRYGLNAIVLDELDAENWQYFDASGTHWQYGFAFAQPILNAGAIVNACCLKAHRFGGHFTLSLKNTVGMVARYVPGDPHDYMAELHSSPDQRLMIAEINKAYEPAIVLLDGVEAFINGGPEAGDVVTPGVILAGTDRVAVDVVALGVLRMFNPTPEIAQGSVWDLEQIRRAVELQIGATSDQQIEIITADATSQAMADEVRSLIIA
ncbi:MAG: DUF362 domain-containing protein [Cyanobacteria bacterium CRU_2_1]|nr:DUF362 domain-containing protein [Cyanobacteria bacterium RU_5_0]NJR60962.1 DUF362 domain-containing protein [Cyanobacteria bacterium CRU_2_1]